MEAVRERRVLFLSSWYPNRVLPKNGNFVRRHAQAAARYAKVASLHVISDEQATDFELDAQEKEGVFEVIVYYPKSVKWRPDKKYRNYLDAHRRGYAHIIQNWGEVDLTHLNVTYPAGLFALELKKQFGLPYVITEHWTAFLPAHPYKFSLIEKYLIKKIGQGATTLCPVSEDLQNALINFGFDNPFHVIPNVVDTDIFQASIKRDASPIKILHVSTFKDDHKNISGILRVIARLQKQRNDFQITMAGNRFGEKYNGLIYSLGISSDVLTILPVLPLKEIAQKMKEQHIFLLFSNYENLPCVIAEAHCAGMIVVGSDVGGTREMISPENGLIVQARDEETLFEKLNEAIDNYQIYNTVAISKTAAIRYSYDSVGKTFIQVYQQVLDSK